MNYKRRNYYIWERETSAVREWIKKSSSRRAPRESSLIIDFYLSRSIIRSVKSGIFRALQKYKEKEEIYIIYILEEEFIREWLKVFPSTRARKEKKKKNHNASNHGEVQRGRTAAAAEGYGAAGDRGEERRWLEVGCSKYSTFHISIPTFFERPARRFSACARCFPVL